MRLKAYLLIFDGLADWEPALALCEINKSGKYDVVTVGFTASLKRFYATAACLWLLPVNSL